MTGHRASPICFYLAAAWLAGPAALPLRPLVRLSRVKKDMLEATLRTAWTTGSFQPAGAHVAPKSRDCNRRQNNPGTP